MFRFVAFIFDAKQPAAARSAGALRERLLDASGQWRTTMQAPGFVILCADERNPSFRPRALQGVEGAVLGAVFDRSTRETGYAAVARFDADESAAVLASGGQRLIDNYFGSFVALLRDHDSSQVTVVRDPTGSLPCYLTRTDGVQIAFSCIADCLAMGVRFRIDEDFLQEWVMSGGRNQLLAPLDGLTPVHGGERVRLHPSRSIVQREMLWNPLSFACASKPLEDPAMAVREVHDVVHGAARAWSLGHCDVLHRLSGGLDSSIVLATLTAVSGGPRVHCYTYFDQTGRLDERPWARLAAASCSCDHIERSFAPDTLDLRDALSLRPTVYPTSCIGYLNRPAIDREVMQRTDAQLVFSGDGGDSGFCSDSIALAPADYLRRYGLRPRVLRLAAQVGLRIELSAWTVLRRSLRRWMCGSRMADQREGLLRGSDLLHPALRESLGAEDRYPHPWFQHEASVPWSTIRRMGQLVYAAEFYDPSADASDRTPVLVAPLYSQPVIETLLRVPMHVHFLHGVDRGLARRAFAGEVPERILRRTWKDNAPGYFDRVVAANRPFLRSLLLDGALVERGLLDRRAVERALQEHGAELRVLPGELLRRLDAEVWARAWRS